MGYCMSMSASNFFVSTENVGRFLSVLWRYPYDYTFDVDGNITEIEYVGEKLGRDFELFQKVAPFVRDGSFIEMYGEDGERWRWIFKNGKCREVTAKVTWGWTDD